MSTKITYLLGAGASCGSLPLASRLGEGMLKSFEQACKDIEKIHGIPGQPYPPEKKPWPKGEYAKDFLESLKWLAEYSLKHATVDTLARKFWIRQDDEAFTNLHRLKAVLSCYFLYEQSRLYSDKRYDSFFASILNRSKPGVPIFPNTISIVSWNYDLLLEKSYYEYSANEEVVWEHITNNEKIVRLNGRAAAATPTFQGIRPWPKWKYIDLIYYSEELHIEKIIELYNEFLLKDMPKRLNPDIFFAWEVDNIADKTKVAASGTEILVIIGYSFPFFNQEIDKIFLEQMSPTLKKIFLQTNEDYAGRERLLNILDEIPNKSDQREVKNWKEKIEMIKGTDYFYIPNEFTRE